MAKNNHADEVGEVEREISASFADSCLYDDEFFGSCLELNKKALQEILRIFLERKDLKLVRCSIQKTVVGLGGRSLRADAWAVDKDGGLHLVEIHKGGSLKEIQLRVSFQAGVLNTKAVKKGIKFEQPKSLDQIPQQHVLFISDHDPFGANDPCYDVIRVVKNKKLRDADGEPMPFEDRIQIRIINGAWKGEDEIGRLVADMHERDLDKINNSEIKKAERSIKRVEEDKMDKTHEAKMKKLLKYLDDRAERKVAEANKQIEEMNRETARRMKSEGLAFDLISRVTGIQAQEVAAL